MKKTALIGLVILTSLTCSSKKTDRELFETGPLRLEISASSKSGFVPLDVSFEAYLQEGERIIEKEVEHIRWSIRGPSGYEREIVQGGYDYRDATNNKTGVFYMEYQFFTPGTYRVQLHLNHGEVSSRPIKIKAMESERTRGRRF